MLLECWISRVGSREVALSQVKVQNRSDSGLWLGRILEVPVKAGIVYLFAEWVVRVSPVILDVSEYLGSCNWSVGCVGSGSRAEALLLAQVETGKSFF